MAIAVYEVNACIQTFFFFFLHMCFCLCVGAVNILQQIIELSSESHDAVASMVAMAPGTVTVVEQVKQHFIIYCVSQE